MATPTLNKIPPRVVSKAYKLRHNERTMYVQNLIGQYEWKVRHLEQLTRDAMPSWIENQRAHLETVIAQLYELRDE